MTSAATDRTPLSPARLVAFWLIIQVAALALAAGRVPFSARFFQPAERMAFAEMLVIQLTAASLTFPVLLQTRLLACLVMFTTIPMLLLANALSRYSLREVLPAIGYVELCLLTMSVWAHLLRTVRSQLIGTCAASTLSLFGAALWYLTREYQPESRDFLQFFSPLIAVGSNSHQFVSLWAFTIPSSMFLVGVLTALVTRRGVQSKSRHVLH